MMRRFCRWLRARHLNATLAEYERTLADIRALRHHCDEAEQELQRLIAREQVAYYHATRKEVK